MTINKFFLASIFLSFALVFALTEGFDFSDKELETQESLWGLYERWRSHHKVSTSLDDKKRFNVFKANVRHVHNVNKMDKPYKLKLNKFADMTNHEFTTSYAGSKVKHHRMLHGDSRRTTGNFMYENVASVPPSIDWREKGAVNAIKDQGQCGSCWAFSTVVGVEGIHQIRTNELVSLSEQELVDCDTSENEGCNGGLMPIAYEFIQERGGITTESNYPYNAEDGSCDGSKLNSALVSIDGHEMVPENDEDALLKAAANQPISVAMDAGGSDFQFYSEGVYNGDCGTELNHGVAIVGYGETQDGTKYWTMRNSWGQGWGERGYFRMERGISAKQGQCGIAMEASYPIKNSSTNPTGTGKSTKDEL